jgi:hypothetical protein
MGALHVPSFVHGGTQAPVAKIKNVAAANIQARAIDAIPEPGSFI